MAEPIDQRFVYVLDNGESTGHIAVKSTVTDGHFTLVAGCQDDGTEFVRQGHQKGSANACLQVFFRRIFGKLVELWRQCTQK